MKTLSINALAFATLLSIGSIYAGKEASKTDQEPITLQERIKHGALGAVKAACALCNGFFPVLMAHEILTGTFKEKDIPFLAVIPLLTYSTYKLSKSAWRSIARAVQKPKQPTTQKS